MPNISITRYNELLRKEKELDERRSRKHAKVFAKQLCKDIGVVLALTPMVNWPGFAKQIALQSAKSCPTSFECYKSLLPK